MNSTDSKQNLIALLTYKTVLSQYNNPSFMTDILMCELFCLKANFTTLLTCELYTELLTCNSSDSDLSKF